jgi:hypothetical protein
MLHRCKYPVQDGKPEDQRFKDCGKLMKYYAFRTHLKKHLDLEPEKI